MDLLTYTEAAELTGLTNKTIQRHIKKGVLSVVDTPVGKRIPREALEKYQGLRRDRERQGQFGPDRDLRGQLETSTDIGDTQARTGTDREGQWSSESSSVPLSAHLAALDLARNQLESLQRIIDEAHRQIEQSHLQALGAERAKLSLEIQLEQYQRVLTEQCESLAEERALRLVAEAKSLDLEPKLGSSTKSKGWSDRLRLWLGLVS